MENNNSIPHLFYHCLEVAELSENLLRELPPTCPEAPGDRDSFLHEEQREESLKTIIEFLELLFQKSVAFVNSEAEMSLENLIDVTQRLRKLLIRPFGWDDREEYPYVVNDFTEEVAKFRDFVDKNLTCRSFQTWLYRALEPSYGKFDTLNDNTSEFTQKLEKAADYIREHSPDGVPGDAIAKFIGVRTSTFRKHYVPALEKKHGVRNYQNTNEGSGYYIPGMEFTDIDHAF